MLQDIEHSLSCRVKHSVMGGTSTSKNMVGIKGLLEQLRQNQSGLKSLKWMAQVRETNIFFGHRTFYKLK